ncbi:X-ray repair cross-complementing protein 5-like [Venturia canescens]|uniref:X-ray repair cross-complementing protein 5-like n=1 Tax=Venturia canescens TaxID=32260 RepID=UPI001C9D47B2|nr:X-ray repair cross-complementing protein 5-like [Venturia canescens]XP_043269155.1 X-ray repair cross-complementing protein 5-like [Venturia canescens]XP_043269156.1 X-ray repair cross-complementing protein 5-like [Venturia canescens]
MPAKSDTEIVFFLTHVGITKLNENAVSFEKSKKVMKLVAEKKIFLRPKDEIGIMVTGHSDYDSEVDEKCTMLYQPSQVPTWDMVENILDLKQSKNSFRNWPKALKEVFEELKQLSMESRLILILLFDCDDPCPDADSTDSAALINEIKEMDIRLLWIGSKLLNDLEVEKLNDSERLLKKIVDEVEGKYMTIEQTLQSLRIFENSKDRYMAWKCLFEIGDMKIATLTYVKAKEDDNSPTFSSINTSVEDDEEKSNVARAERDFVDRHREAHPISDTISGYMYGRKFIPVSEADEAGLLENTEKKSFELLGFVRRSKIRLEHLVGDSSRIVLPDGPEAAKSLYTLGQALELLDRVAIVRRVYNANSDPKLNVFVPSLDLTDEPSCFILVELIYQENRRFVQPVSLTSAFNVLEDEEVDAVGNLINSMLLYSNDGEDDELFVAEEVPSPGLQHLWNSLSHRALNPDAPLPPMDEDLKKSLETPDFIKANSEPHLKKLRQLFPKEKKEDVPSVPENTNQKAISEPSEVKKLEPKYEEKVDEPISRPDESAVDLDELFDGEMDM